MFKVTLKYAEGFSLPWKYDISTEDIVDFQKQIFGYLITPTYNNKCWTFEINETDNIFVVEMDCYLEEIVDKTFSIAEKCYKLKYRLETNAYTESILVQINKLKNHNMIFSSQIDDYFEDIYKQDDTVIKYTYNTTTSTWETNHVFDHQINPQSQYGQALDCVENNKLMSIDLFETYIFLYHGSCSEYAKTVKEWILEQGIDKNTLLKYPAWLGLWSGYKISVNKCSVVTDKEYNVLQSIRKNLLEK